MIAKIYVRMPPAPGATPSLYPAESLEVARRLARRLIADRPDLRGQDVRIERTDGQLIEYAGPSS